MAADTKKKRQKSLVKSIGLVAMLFCSGFFLYALAQDVSTCFSLKNSIQENQARADELAGQKKELETRKNNLTNPDYAEFLARGKYLVTKEGEQIFKFPAIDKSRD